MTALSATAERAAVLDADAAKNVYGGTYHVREPESQALVMRFGEAAECVAVWQSRRMLVRACAPWCSQLPVDALHSSESHPRPECKQSLSSCSKGEWRAQTEVMHAPSPALGNAAPAPPAQPHGRPQACDDLGQGLQADLANRIDWKWLQACARFHLRRCRGGGVQRNSPWACHSLCAHVCLSQLAADRPARARTCRRSAVAAQHKLVAFVLACRWAASRRARVCGVGGAAQAYSSCAPVPACS